ncbi:hypothetical protein ID866_6343 [Astraeus odoratus]|nr:hypothetical protein ID866_6343 [Astraeus odoratus]
MEDILIPYLFACVGVVVCAIFSKKLTSSPNLKHIPTVGPSSLLGSYWSAIKFVTHGTEVIQEGYDKYKGSVFKVSNLDYWLVILNRNHVEDVMRFPEEELSFEEAANDTQKTEFTLGPEIFYDPYHFSITRSQLTRNIPALYSGMREEMAAAFYDTLGLEGNEWKSVLAAEVIEKVVCRTSNRAFVGLPLCRDPGWNKLNIQLAADFVKEVVILNLVPKFIVPLVAKFVTNLSGRNRQGAKYLAPMITERLQHMGEYGKLWSDKPNDFLQWCLDEGKETAVLQITQRILTINLAAIHTFLQVLYNLAANPQYIQPLREEVESVIAEEGWTKNALQKMRRVDSFLKESQRFEGITSLGITRKALKDITLSDGTLIPKGTYVAVPAHAIHHDACIYENPHAFEPFRFADMREQQGESSRHQMVAVSPESLAFGCGKAACPGRFFAAVVLKSMLAHIVVSYDVKLETNTSRPKSKFLGPLIAASHTARVMFRKRL